MSRVSPFLPPRRKAHQQRPPSCAVGPATAFRSVCSPCRNPNRLLRHERFEFLHKPLSGLWLNSQSARAKGLVSRVSPFLPSASQGSSTAPAFLRCRTLRPRSDPCVAHVVIPTDYYDMSALRIPSQAAKRLVKEFLKAQGKKDSCHESAPFCPPRRKAHQQRPPSCAVGPCDRVQIRV